MVLREPFGWFGLPFLGFRRHALHHPPQGLGTSQSIVLGQFRRFLHVAGRVMPNQINQAIHPALTAAAFFVKPFLAQTEGVRADGFGLGQQSVRFPGRIEDPVPGFHHQGTRPLALWMPANDLHPARIENLDLVHRRSAPSPRCLTEPDWPHSRSCPPGSSRHRRPSVSPAENSETASGAIPSDRVFLPGTFPLPGVWPGHGSVAMPSDFPSAATIHSGPRCCRICVPSGRCSACVSPHFPRFPCGSSR